MTLRVFEREGDMLVDVYGTNASGKPMSFRATAEALSELRWRSSPRTDTSARASVDWKQRRDALLERLRRIPRGEVLVSDFVEARDLAEPRARVPLIRCFAEVRSSGQQSRVWDAQDLSTAAGAILAIDPTHVPSARQLVVSLVDRDAPELSRRYAAATIASVFRSPFVTPAMRLFHRVLYQILYGQSPLRWGSSVYTCVRPFLTIDRSTTLELCEVELRSVDEWSRALLLNELSDVATADVLAVLARHFEAERSTRVRLRIARIMGETMAIEKRERALVEALTDPSPSCRYIAIKTLRMVGLVAAKGLAARVRHAEPDPVLAALLEQVIEYDGAARG